MKISYRALDFVTPHSLSACRLKIWTLIRCSCSAQEHMRWHFSLMESTFIRSLLLSRQRSTVDWTASRLAPSKCNLKAASEELSRQITQFLIRIHCFTWHKRIAKNKLCEFETCLKKTCTLLFLNNYSNVHIVSFTFGRSYVRSPHRSSG